MRITGFEPARANCSLTPQDSVSAIPPHPRDSVILLQVKKNVHSQM